MDGAGDPGDTNPSTHRPIALQPPAEVQVRAVLRQLTSRPVSPAARPDLLPPADTDGASSPRTTAGTASTSFTHTQSGLPPRPPKSPHLTHVQADTRTEAVGIPVSSSRPRSADPWGKRMQQSPSSSPDVKAVLSRRLSEGHPSEEGLSMSSGPARGPMGPEGHPVESPQQNGMPRGFQLMEQQLAALMAAQPERVRLESQTSTGSPAVPRKNSEPTTPPPSASTPAPTTGPSGPPSGGPSGKDPLGNQSVGAGSPAGPGSLPGAPSMGPPGLPTGLPPGYVLSRHPSSRLPPSGTVSRRASVRHELLSASRQLSMRDSSLMHGGPLGAPQGSSMGSRAPSGPQGMNVARQVSHLDALIVSRKPSKEDRTAHVSAAGDLHLHVPTEVAAQAAAAQATMQAARKSTGHAPDVIIENDQFDDVMDFWEQEQPTQKQHKPWYRREEVWQRIIPAACTGILFLSAFVMLPQSNIKLLGFGVWKWLLWTAWLTPLSWISVAGVHLVMLLVESTYLATRMVVYFMMGTKPALAGVVWSALSLGIFTSIFTIEKGPEGSTSAFVYATIVKLLCCVLLFHAAILLRILLARMMAAHFHKSAYFSKMHDALRKEYFLMAMSQPRRPVGTDEGEIAEHAASLALPHELEPQEVLVGPCRAPLQAIKGALKTVRHFVSNVTYRGPPHKGPHRGRWGQLQSMHLEHEHEATPLMNDSQFAINMEQQHSQGLQRETPTFSTGGGVITSNPFSQSGSQTVLWGEANVQQGVAASQSFGFNSQPATPSGPQEGQLGSVGSIEFPVRGAFAQHSAGPSTASQGSLASPLGAATSGGAPGALAGAPSTGPPSAGAASGSFNRLVFLNSGSQQLPAFARMPSGAPGGSLMGSPRGPAGTSGLRGPSGAGSQSGPGAVINVTAQAGPSSSTTSVVRESTMWPSTSWAWSPHNPQDSKTPVLVRSRTATLSELGRSEGPGALGALDLALVLPSAPSILPLSRPCGSVATVFSPANSVQPGLHPIKTHAPGLSRTASAWVPSSPAKGTFLDTLHAWKERTTRGLRRQKRGHFGDPMGPSASTHKLYKEVFHIHNRNKRKDSAHGTPRKSRHNSGVGADGQLLAALHRLEKHIRKTKLKMTFAEQLGVLRNAANDATTKEAEKAAAEVNSVAEARKMAFYLFWNIKEDFDRSHILPTDLEHFLPPDQIKEAFNMLDMDADGKVTLYNIRDAVIAIYRERKNLAATLRDTKTVVAKVETIIGAILHLIFFFIYLAIFNVEMSRVWLSVSSTLLAFAFVFGNSIRTIYESVIFLFVIHPFDVGDAIVVHDDWYRVEEISLMYTVLCRWDNAIIWYPNAKLTTDPLVNLTKSKNKWEKLLLLVDLVTPIPPLLERLTKLLPSFFKQWPSEFTGQHTVVLRDLKDPLKGQVGVFYEYAHPGEDMGRCSMYRSKLYTFVIDIFKDMGVRFSLPPLPDPHHGGPCTSIESEMAPGNPVAHVLAAHQHMPGPVYSIARMETMVPPIKMEPKNKFL